MSANESNHMICWLPWLPLHEPITFGPIEFLPICRETTPLINASGQNVAPDLVDDLNKMMSRFHDIHGQTINKATVVVPRGEMDLHTLNDDALELVRNAADLLMLAFMSSNHYFRPGDSYTNTTMFQLVIQRFVHGSEFASVVSRRRDGHQSDLGYEHGEIVDQMPRALHSCMNATPDEMLLKSLAEAASPQTETHKKILLSLASFRFANTDGLETSILYELVHLQWAIEHLIGPCGGNQDYQKKLYELLGDYATKTADCSSRRDNDAPAENCPRESWPIAKQWAWEHYQLRNAITHGNNLHDRPWRWAADEHCLFAAWFYPFLVKVLLKRDGEYELTSKDCAALHAIDELLAAINWKSNWNRILGDVHFKIMCDSDTEKYLAEHGKSFNGNWTN